MAEIWPRLKKKLSGDARKKKKTSKSKKANPYASEGLEKFAALLEGLQANKTVSSLVERTGASVSAARSLSRSAQEWTVSTLETRLSDYTESFSFSKPGCDHEAPVEEPQTDSENAHSEDSTKAIRGANSEGSVVGDLYRDGNGSGEDRQSMGNDFTSESSEAGPSSTPSGGNGLPVKSGRCVKRMRGLQRTSNSAFVVLVALGAFISNRLGRVANPVASVLAFNAVIRIWRKGKVYARFLFSSVAVYFLTPLRSYLTVCPRQISSLPRKLKVTSYPDLRLAAGEGSQKPEIKAVQGRGNSSLERHSVLPLQESAPVKEDLSLPILLSIPESSAPAEAPVLLTLETIPASGTPSPSRCLAKKFSSGFKKLKKLRSSSSSSSSSSCVPLRALSHESSVSSHHSSTDSTGSSEPGGSVSPSLHSSAASSPRKGPFSWRLHKAKSDTSLEVAHVHGDEATIDKKSSTHGFRKCCLRREKSSEDVCGKKSRMGRMLSSETIEQYNVGEIMPVSTAVITPTSASTALVEDGNGAARTVSWPVVGLLVTLLFLLVGRLPAIMATSLFLLLVSNAHHDRAHSRGRGRDMRTSEAARKLHSSPPPRGRRNPGSPPRRI